MVLDALPLTASGKLDRRALPEPDFRGDVSGRAPRDAREKLLCELAAELLDRAWISIDDDFFDLGGHSLLAARLLNRIRGAFGVRLGLDALFATPTVAGLAATLAATAGQEAPPWSRFPGRSASHCPGPSSACGSSTGWIRSAGPTTSPWSCA